METVEIICKYTFGYGFAGFTAYLFLGLVFEGLREMWEGIKEPTSKFIKEITTRKPNGHKLKDGVVIHWDSKTMTASVDGLELLDNDALQALRDRLLKTNATVDKPYDFAVQAVMLIDDEFLRRGIMPKKKRPRGYCYRDGRYRYIY